MNNKEYLKQSLEKCDISITDQQVDKLFSFKNKLIEWNEKINLTTIIEEKEIIQKHFVDSLIPQKYIPKNSYLLDLGTGAGFPGIPLKILRDDIKPVLMDSVNKKVNYLNETIEKLNLENIQAVHYRAEDAAQINDYREKFDIVITRALSNMRTLSEYMLPFVKIGGIAICMKGPNIQEELEDSKKAIKLLGGEIQEVINYTIPDTDLNYNLVIIKKVNKTPKQYPRKAGKPLKEPIQ